MGSVGQSAGDRRPGGDGYEHGLHATTGVVRVAGRYWRPPPPAKKWELRDTDWKSSDRPMRPIPCKKRAQRRIHRTIAHVRPRSNLRRGFRLRSRLAYEVHQFFQGGICVVRTADYGQRLRRCGRIVSRHHDLKQKKTPEQGQGRTNPTFSAGHVPAVTGNWEAENVRCGCRRYTFGLPYGTRNSHTSRTAAELDGSNRRCVLRPQGDMDLAEEFVKAMVDTPWSTARMTRAVYKFVDKGL